MNHADLGWIRKNHKYPSVEPYQTPEFDVCEAELSEAVRSDGHRMAIGRSSDSSRMTARMIMSSTNGFRHFIG
jgi:hypothetical protein